MEALDRFHINASQLAVFTAVQVGVYALAQIPVGIIIDRVGAKKTMVVGAIIMAFGQGVLALTTSYGIAIVARVFIGAGDATAFLGAMRLLPAWFPLKKTPLFTQLTAGLGQLGQFISAVPFLALLHTSGWVPAFATLSTGGVLVAICAVVALANEPHSTATAGTAAAAGTTLCPARLSVGTTLGIVLKHPVCRSGFFAHWTGLMHQCIFTLLWGMPLMTLGLGLSPAQAGIALVVNTVAVVIAGPLMGMISARAGSRRIIVIAVIAVVDMVFFVIFFASYTAPAFWTMVVLNIGLGALAPMSNLGFNSVREFVDRKVLATGTGLANMGGFIATMIASQGIGILLDYHAAGVAYSWSDFRFAWLAVFAMWLIGMIGLGVSQLFVRRHFPAQRKTVTLA